MDFNLNVIDPCLGINIITQPSSGPYTHDIRLATVSILAPKVWTKSNPLCATAITYSLLNHLTSDPADPIFSLGTNAVQLTTTSSMNAKVGPY
jgi:hypothetical protein